MNIDTSVTHDQFFEVEERAFAYAQKQGMVVVAAAGNDSSDIDEILADDQEKESPDRLDGVVSVSNVEKVGDSATGMLELSSSSNYGASVTLAAPGTDILSDIPTGLANAVAAVSSYTAVPVYRLYNRHSGLHHYVAKTEERDALVKLGWRNEGISWYVRSDAGVKVYRLYNPHSGEHVYTTSYGEYQAVVKAGWHGEGVAWNGVD